MNIDCDIIARKTGPDNCVLARDVKDMATRVIVVMQSQRNDDRPKPQRMRTNKSSGHLSIWSSGYAPAVMWHEHGGEHLRSGSKCGYVMLVVVTYQYARLHTVVQPPRPMLKNQACNIDTYVIWGHARSTEAKTGKQKRQQYRL